jgi:hypothetical protein
MKLRPDILWLKIQLAALRCVCNPLYRLFRSLPLGTPDVIWYPIHLVLRSVMKRCNRVLSRMNDLYRRQIVDLSSERQ